MSAGVVTPRTLLGRAVAPVALAGLVVGVPDVTDTGGIVEDDDTVAATATRDGNVAHVFEADDAVVGSGGRVVTATGAVVEGDDAVAGSGTISVGPTIARVSQTESVDEIGPTDFGAAFQGTGGHTLYGGAHYFDATDYLYTTVNGVGVDPNISGHTGHEVALTGTAPFTADDWGAAAQTVVEGLGYSVSRTGGVLDVSGNGVDPDAAAAAQAALTDFDGRGGGYVLGARQELAGNSTAGNSTGWIQIEPSEVPSGSFRVIGFGVRRGTNVASGIRVSLASGGTADGNPEGATVDAGMTLGDSGTVEWHYEYLPADEVVEYSGGERLFAATHGDGASSSIMGASNVNLGTYEDGSTNLWLTDGTTGSTTPAVSPVGAVTASFNFGLCLRLIIQEAPYQNDGGYRVIGGAEPGVHDQDLFPGGTNVDAIFVGWRIVPPVIDGLSRMDTRLRLGAHAAGASNQIRVEWWTPTGGASTMAGDTNRETIGVTSDTQGTGWSSIQSAPVAVTGGAEYRYTIKGEPETDEEADTYLDFWFNADGASLVTTAGHPSAYAPAGVSIPATELEVQAAPDSGTPETAIDFDPQVATVTPNPSNGTVTAPDNLPMIALYFGKAAPTVTAV